MIMHVVTKLFLKDISIHSTECVICTSDFKGNLTVNLSAYFRIQEKLIIFYQSDPSVTKRCTKLFNGILVVIYFLCNLSLLNRLILVSKHLTAMKLFFSIREILKMTSEVAWVYSLLNNL